MTAAASDGAIAVEELQIAYERIRIKRAGRAPGA